uniref:transmembrane channel-like protein 7 isoform X2 n=1 Tax=Pristiophorus japonicus TaxID=55135 RepID=UPI00398EE235
MAVSSPKDSKSDVYLSINELLHELPSYRSLVRRPSTNIAGSRRKSVLSNFFTASISRKKGDSLTDLEDDRPLRELPVSIKEKRRIRARQDYQANVLAKQEQGYLFRKTAWRRFAQATKEHISNLYLWKRAIHDIEGKFGTGIQSYFSFLRFLVLLNFVNFLLMFTFVTIPMIISKHGVVNITHVQVSSSVVAEECTVYEAHNQGLILFYSYMINLLSGTGFLEQTYLFYGFYKTDNLMSGNFHYNLPLAYFITTFSYILLSLFWIVKRAVEGFKRSFIRSEDRFQSFCNKIFAGWDFCITDQHAAQLKHSSLQYELQTDLDEDRIKQKIADRTKREKIRIYFLRVLLNLLVAMILATCFYCIYKTTVYSQQYGSSGDGGSFAIDLLIQYLPSIVITAANFVTPLLFEHIIRFEDYSPAFEIKFILIRSVFVRLANIIVLLVTLWTQITKCDGGKCLPCGYNNKLYPCWETRIGQEMYKLMIFDLIIISAVTLFVEFPRKLIVTYCSGPPFTWWGQQQFAIPQNVLEIVYGQTICWIGTFYSPLLPGIATIKYFFIFYIKRISLMNNCRPSTRPFRASSSNFFFLAVLLIGLPLACIPIVFGIALISSSKACGPFIKYNTAWNIIPETINNFPKGLRHLLYGLGSEAFAVPFFVFVCLILFYLVALAGAHKRVVNQLRDQLTMQGRDKQYLIRKLTRETVLLRRYSSVPNVENE